ncbi:MAG: alpha-isopropylmalate synthase regulatory domain-containing protein, partial [Woeseiaceae bacterium]
VQASATVTLIDEHGAARSETAAGSGPVEAAFNAIEAATGTTLVLRNFEIHSATIGDDAQGEATVVVEVDGQSYRGQGASTDIVEAGCRAYLEVVNRVLRRRQRGAGTDRSRDMSQATI